MSAIADRTAHAVDAPSAGTSGIDCRAYGALARPVDNPYQLNPPRCGGAP